MKEETYRKAYETAKELIDHISNYYEYDYSTWQNIKCEIESELILIEEDIARYLQPQDQDPESDIPKFPTSDRDFTMTDREQEKQTAESLQYIKKIETLIGLGDTINIKARLIHLKRMIEDDLKAMKEYASQSQSLTFVLQSDEEIEKEIREYYNCGLLKLGDIPIGDMVKGAIWFKSQLKRGYPKEFVEFAQEV